MLPALLVDGSGLRRHLGLVRWSLGGTVSLDECDLFANPDTTVNQELEMNESLTDKRFSHQTEHKIGLSQLSLI